MVVSAQAVISPDIEQQGKRTNVLTKIHARFHPFRSLSCVMMFLALDVFNKVKRGSLGLSFVGIGLELQCSLTVFQLSLQTIAFSFLHARGARWHHSLLYLLPREVPGGTIRGASRVTPRLSRFSGKRSAAASAISDGDIKSYLRCFI